MHTRKTAARAERIFANARDAARYRYAYELAAVPKRIVANARDFISIYFSRNYEFCADVRRTSDCTSCAVAIYGVIVRSYTINSVIASITIPIISF